jgi:hypothetical protein
MEQRILSLEAPLGLPLARTVSRALDGKQMTNGDRLVSSGRLPPRLRCFESWKSPVKTRSIFKRVDMFSHEVVNHIRFLTRK